MHYNQTKHDLFDFQSATGFHDEDPASLPDDSAARSSDVV
jgi:hypothetical protein